MIHTYFMCILQKICHKNCVIFVQMVSFNELYELIPPTEFVHI